MFKGDLLPVRPRVIGAAARIYDFVRANDRCPCVDFLKDLEAQTLKKYKGSFDALSKLGPDYYNPQRFKPLIGAGKPLWEFKEFDNRLYCFRTVKQTNTVDVVLLSGWVKDKKGRTEREVREVQSAQGLLNEFMQEFPGGKIA